MVAAGTVPLVVVGLALHSVISNYFGSVWVAAAGLLLTAGFLLIVHRDNEGRELDEMTWREAIVIGCVQCVAIVPGVSRSGSTISAATRLGIAPQAAARFSFFLAIPAIGGAVVMEAKDLFGDAAVEANAVLLGAGLVCAFGVGFLALKLLIEMLKRGKLAYFGYYCVLIAVVVAALQVL